jgi:hypothetical protein
MKGEIKEKVTWSPPVMSLPRVGVGVPKQRNAGWAIVLPVGCCYVERLDYAWVLGSDNCEPYRQWQRCRDMTWRDVTLRDAVAGRVSSFPFTPKHISRRLNKPQIKQSHISVISGFRREVDKNCALLGYYTACSGNSLQTFRDKLSVPSSMVQILNHWIWYG